MKLGEKRINVLHLIDHYRVGGPGKTIINSARFAYKNRFTIHVGTFISKTSTEFQKALEQAGIPVLTLKDNRGIHFGNVLKLCSYITQKKIDIVHTHGYKTDIYGLIGKVFSKKVKLVTTHHGWIMNNMRQVLYTHISLFLTRFFDGIIVVSENLMGKIPPGTKRRVPYTCIHNALVIADYAPNGNRKRTRIQLGIDQDDIAIGVIGRLSPEKGCVEMLEAFNILQKEGNQGKAKLIFVGEGILAENLTTKINSLGIEDNVIIAGYIHPIQSIYEALDIVVSPSRTEGLSNVILEALSYRLPVVATAVGGTPEIIADGYNGILVRPGGIEDLKNALLKLIKSPSLRYTLGSNGYKTLLEAFTFDLRIKREALFYESIISKHVT